MIGTKAITKGMAIAIFLAAIAPELNIDDISLWVSVVALNIATQI